MQIRSGRAGVALCSILLGAAVAQAQTQARVSVASGGVQANGGSSAPAITPDGRYIAFVSSATNLTADATAGIFRHDRLGGTTILIASGSAPSISDDGQFVAFTSNVDNLVANDANGLADIFIWSAAGGTFQRVTPSTGPQHLVQIGRISGNGQFVAYSAQVGTAAPQNVVFDRIAGTHSPIGEGGLHEPNYISADGRWVAYTQSASSPLPNDTNGRRDVYLFDRQVGITTIASTTSGGAALGDADSEVSGLSADGRYVLFSSSASNFPGTRATGANTADLFLKDMQSGSLVQVNTTGGQRVGPVIELGPGFAMPSLSANGRFVVFASTAANVGVDTNGLQDTFLWDRDPIGIVRVSVPESGGAAAGGRSKAGVASNDGRYIAFESEAHNLVPGDTNFDADIFLRDVFGAPPCAVTIAPAGLAVVSNAGGNGTINVTAPSACAWTATVNAPWIRTTGSIISGVGDGAVSYVFDPYVGGTTIRSGAIVVNTAGYGLRQLGNAVTQAPFGPWETPVPGPGGVTNVSGAVPFTGWALDDVQVSRIRVFRDPVAGEGGAQVFVGDAVQVAGARPDVVAAFPSYPYNTSAGWGLMVLTNMLPNQGNGVFTFHVYFDDPEGHTTLAGSRTLTGTNASSTEPFGTIDTPAQGATVSGTFVNFGWALTPQPASIPSDGSTISVFIDGVNVGRPSYGHPRSDIAALFPEYANASGPVGHFTVDTTAYTDGVHTIAWVVTDNLGRAAGIGSRYFTIQNGTAPVTPPFARREPSQATVRSAQPILNVRGEAGRWVAPDAAGVYDLRVRDLDRIELRLDPWHGPASCGTFTAASLPAGASLDARSGVLAWQPAPGVGGTHDIAVTRTSCGGVREQLTVRIVFEKR